jgi:RimJ/RimL family protein N-acetyltransferase
MRHQSRVLVDESWAELFAIEPHALWSEVTVRPHGTLGDYEGLVVAWRGDGVHVSAPAIRSSAVAESLAAQGIRDLQTPEFWSAYARSIDKDVIGPSTHHYLDEDPGTPAAVVRVEASDVHPMRHAVSALEWEESGFDDDAQLWFGFPVDGHLVAAANLTSYAEAPRDVGVLVVPDARGQRLVDEVGRAAASYAVSRHGLARWRARTTNRASLGAARRLGFEPWCTQLAIR